VTKPSVISEEKKHLSSVPVSNGYPSSFVQKLTRTRKAAPRVEPETQFKSTAVLPYIKGVSEPLRRCLQQQGIRACECEKVYIGETGSSMQERIKEHDGDIRLARTQASAVSEHANKTGHHPL